MVFKQSLLALSGALGYTVLKRRSNMALLMDVANHLYPDRPILFLDGGANTGQTILDLNQVFAQSKSRPRVEVLSFEPVSSNYEVLIKNAKTCHNIDVKTYPIGLSDAEKTFELNLAPHSYNHSIANNDLYAASGLGKEVIRLKAIDQLLGDRDLSNVLVIIKLNIEGHELQAIEGAEQLINSGQDIIFMVEVTFDPENKQHAYFQDIYSHLSARGFVCSQMIEVTPSFDRDHRYKPALAHVHMVFCRQRSPR
jgi:FkbM family methyltransferase